MNPEALLGHFVSNYHGTALTTTNDAWASEISIMQKALQPWKDESGQVIFEYDIPRLGKRIDVVLLLRGMIFCLEFKKCFCWSPDVVKNSLRGGKQQYKCKDCDLQFSGSFRRDKSQAFSEYIESKQTLKQLAEKYGVSVNT